MDTILLVTLILNVIGIGIVLFAFFKMKNQDIVDLDNEHVKEYISDIKVHIDDADKTIGELDEFSTTVKQELDDRYKELLYLYQMIDNAKQEAIFKVIDEPDSRLERTYDRDTLVDTSIKDTLIFNKKHKDDDLKQGSVVKNQIIYNIKEEDSYEQIKKFEDTHKPICIEDKKNEYHLSEEILKLFDKGESVSNIAKKLGIGHGEVQLTINLDRKQVAND